MNLMAVMTISSASFAVLARCRGSAHYNRYAQAGTVRRIK